MCGIIGYVNHGVTKEDMQVLKQVFLESRIRGKHASGLAWFDGHKIQSYVSSFSLPPPLPHSVSLLKYPEQVSTPFLSLVIILPADTVVSLPKT